MPNTISDFWKDLNAKTIPWPFLTGGSFIRAILILAVFDSATALALQSSNNRDYLNVPAQYLYVIFTEIYIG